jgi:integrase
MRSQAIHPKVVQETLGHSIIQMTMDVYSSVVPGMGRDAATQLSNLIGGENGGPQAKRRG